MFPEQASTFAGDIDWLFWLIVGVVGYWFIVAEAILFLFIFKFRRKEGTRARYLTGDIKEEKKWVTIPHILVILCDIVLVAGTVIVWNKVKIDLPEPEETVRVIGQQWAWTFIHPGPDGELDTEDDIPKVDELHVREGTVYHFKLESKDVVHSFSVPVFRLKQDAVPGREITGWFEPNRPGEYDIQCAEMCGIGHGLMVAKLYIESAQDHENWMTAEARKAKTPTAVATVSQ